MAERNGTWKTITGWIIVAIAIPLTGLVYRLTADTITKDVIDNKDAIKNVCVRVDDLGSQTKLNKAEIDHLRKDVDELKDIKKQLDRIEDKLK